MSEIERIRTFYDDPGEPNPEIVGARLDVRLRRERGAGALSCRDSLLRLAIAMICVCGLAGGIALLPASKSSHVSQLAPGPASAATVLKRAAERAATVPDLKPGQVLYSHGTRVQLATNAIEAYKPFSFYFRSDEEIWVGLASRFRLRWSGNSIPVSFPTLADRARALAVRPWYRGTTAHTQPATQPPSTFPGTFEMTLKQMRQLPTDPRALAHELGRASLSAHGDSDPFTTAMHVLTGPARPAAKAAFLRALALLPHVRRLPDRVIDGERLYRVALRARAHLQSTRRPHGSIVLINPETGVTIAAANSFHSRTLAFDHILTLDATTGRLVASQEVIVDRFAHLPKGAVLTSWKWEQRITG